MKKIESYEWLKQSIEVHRAQKNPSNFFFMAQKIQGLVGDGRLFFAEAGKNLFLFEREAGFYRMYYFLGELEADVDIKADLPVVIEFPYRVKYSAAQELEAAYIRRQGFFLARRSCVMSVKAQDVILTGLVPRDGITIHPAKEAEQEQIAKLLFSSFDPHFAFLPDTAELRRLIGEGRILAIYDAGVLAGVIDVELRGKVSWIWHFTVAPAYRKGGLGKVLLEFAVGLHQDKAEEFMLWVDVENEVAVRLYQKFGYTFSAKCADEYLRNC